MGDNNQPKDETTLLAERLQAVRREVLTQVLAHPPSKPVPEEVRRHSAMYLRRFYDAFADFILTNKIEQFKARREPMRRAMLEAGLPSEVAIEMDKVVAAELVRQLPDYAGTILDRTFRSQMTVVETNIKRFLDRT